MPSPQWTCINSHIKQLCAVVANIILLASITCASDSIRFKTWNTENGLPQNSVISITQTADGYIWIATYDGLARFDGVRFKVFKKLDTPELPTNRLMSLLVDSANRLWILTEDANIVVVYENGRFTRFTRGKDFEADHVSEPWRLKKSQVAFRAGDSEYAFEGGVFHRRDRSVPQDFPKLFWDESGSICIEGGDVVYCGKDGKLDPDTQLNNLKRDSAVIADRLSVEINGSYWFLFPDERLNTHLSRLKDGKLTVYPIKAGRVVPHPDFANTSSLLRLDRSGNLWIADFEAGAIRIDRTTIEAADPKKFPFETMTPQMGFTDGRIRDLFVDRSGNLWFGSEKGLHLLKDTVSVKVFSKEDELPSENIYSVIQDRTGTIWFGAWDSSLVRYQGGKFSTEPFDLVSALFEDRDSRLWVGNTGIQYREGNKWLVPPNDPLGLPLPGIEINTITQDRSGHIWYGGAGVGIARYDGASGKRFTTAEGLPSNSVTSFLQKADGTIWVGTTSGLARLDGDRFTSFTTAHGLGGNYIRSLYEDRSGTLWIGGYDSGITRFKNGEFKSITSKQGLFSDGVFCILEDDAGWLWMNSNQGIHRVRRQDLNDVADGKLLTVTSASYGPEDGLKNVEGNGGKQPAGIRASDGKLWFPTAGGLAVVDPSLVQAESEPPRVLLEEILIDQKEVTYPDRKVTLTPKQTDLEINYTGISFINAEQVRFKYRLDGLDNQWIDAGVRRTAYFSHLPYGEYTFHVLAANREGVWATADASIRIIVERPFYRTNGFYGLVSLLLVGLVGFLYFTRVNQLREIASAREDYARQLIEAQELERSRIAMELHDSLGQSLAVIRNRALLGLSAPEKHERLVDQMKEISEASAAALQETRNIARDLHPYQLEHLGLATAIRSLVDRIEEASDIKFALDVRDIDPSPASEVAIAFYRILQESLSNIIKHSGAANVSVSLVNSSGNLELKITDDGRGFTRSEIRQGLGIKGIEQRAKMIGAEVTIDSEPGKGTRIILLLHSK